VRAPDTRPSRAEVARDIARDFGFKDERIPAIEQCLRSLDVIRRDIKRFPKIADIKRDLAGLRRHAEKLHAKYEQIPALALPLRVVMQLGPEKFSGADPRFDQFKYTCALMAKGVIFDSPNKQLGTRLRQLAVWFYWYATGINLDDKDYALERACREVTPKRTNRTSK